MTHRELEELNDFAARVRKGVVDAIYSAKSGHPGGSLSCVDILTYLYLKKLTIDCNNPRWEQRDRFVMSKGHAAPALYSVLANMGFFPVQHLNTLRKIGSHLQGHPSMDKTAGVDMSTGSLGQGLSAAVGMALAAKVHNEQHRVYVIVGDGELNEGIVWEAVMFANHYKLDNLCVVVDNNGLQIDGENSQVMDSAPIDEKFVSFGWNVITCDAHDFELLGRAFEDAENFRNKPTVIIATSVKGRGVSFMEGQVDWHGKALNEQQYQQALQELANMSEVF